MNPPYDKNLHLKILREAMNHSDDIVNLSPNIFRIYRYIMGQMRPYFEMFNNKKVEIIEFGHDESNKYFGLAHQISELAIYHIQSNGDFDYNKKIFKNEIQQHLWDKIIKVKEEKCLPWENKYSKRHGPQEGHFVNYYCWHGTPDMNARERLLDFSDRVHTRTMYFENEVQVDNFIKSFDTKFVNYYVKNVTNANGHTHCFILPREMYNNVVDDNMLYEYFQLTNEEIEEIETEVK